MKAIIMAGGEGTRLRPVSSNVPKPMVRILDRPVLAHILGLLKKNGVDKACLTLRYMPRTIIDYISGEDFGIELETRVEDIPLGTAGGVAACADFIGEEDFLVISGDCICDFDLKRIMELHKNKNAEVTIALYEHSEPLEYGLVVTNPDGRITRFIEKPPWEGVVTNRINTGIYVISPKILHEIPENTPYDFGKNLFPKLLSADRALYGAEAAGYWCDIGSPEAYRQCCADIIAGRANADIGAPMSQDGVFTKVPVPAGVTIVPPVYIGTGAELRAGAVIGPHAVIGAGSIIAAGASVRESVILSATVRDGASVTGAVICAGAVIGRGAQLRENAVIGEGTLVGDNAVVAESVKIQPGRNLQDGILIKDSIEYGHLRSGPVFGERGVISGCPGADITPFHALTLGQAAAEFSRVGLAFSGGEAARVAAEAIGCGVCAYGGELIRFDSALPSCASYFAMSFNLPLTICVGGDSDRLDITIFGKNGGPLGSAAERKLLSPPGDKPPAAAPGRSINVCGAFEAYVAAAARYGIRAGGAESIKVCVAGSGSQNRALKSALSQLGCVLTSSTGPVPCFESRRGGIELFATDETGRSHNGAKTQILAAAIMLAQGDSELTVSHDAPSVLERLAEDFGAKIYRSGGEADEHFAKSRAMRDAAYASVLICAWMRREKKTLAELFDTMTPSFTQTARELPVSRGRGEVMSLLAAAACESGAELSEGIRINQPRGTVVITPLRNKQALILRAEAATEEIAQELCAEYQQLIETADRQ